MDISAKFFELNDRDAPMVNTDFFKWLELNNTGNSIEDFNGYLNERFEFVRGKDKISSLAVQTLRTIQQHFYYLTFGCKW